jgi:hypothetical protein
LAHARLGAARVSFRLLERAQRGHKLIRQRLPQRLLVNDPELTADPVPGGAIEGSAPLGVTMITHTNASLFFGRRNPAYRDDCARKEPPCLASRFGWSLWDVCNSTD